MEQHSDTCTYPRNPCACKPKSEIAERAAREIHMKYCRYMHQNAGCERDVKRDAELVERAIAESRGQLAQSSNYFADDELFPRKVTFANGRTVEIADRPEGAFLVVGKLPPKGNENV